MSAPPTDRPAVRPRSGRRPIPPLIFLLVLALAALTVWWSVLQDEQERDAQQAAACTSAAAAPPSLDPGTLSVRVFNATDQGGLAQSVAAELQGRGFVVEEIANDPTSREVTGVGEIRHGPRGNDAAAFLGLFLRGAGDYLDTRATAVVDLVLGPEFVFPDSLTSPEDVAAALRSVSSASAAC
ncbi:LytR C-terminal domain-containing protein [Geodermatophilus ruber]|uniref:LytR cell envelope-related transcriptional attenuator n=1 Tax=Geodermatophilus ruber TaxID=504800 RepID=A0A1I4EVI0_9ACTN|nr:LytR C-terminal domain-containing protein [Geodermatophilus ruber]SFL09203.1 LytR cell envelope-related transcriptional attenuator [Geodermatophilus ruber]